MVKIAICAPGKPLKRERADALDALVAGREDVSLHFHEQCFLEEGHFAGSDEIRLAALLECTNDPGYDAVWFAMGGYGSNRIAARAITGMNEEACAKSYLGYSDTGFLLGALYRHGIGRVAHGPLAGDIRREGGAAAIERALDWLKGGEAGLEPHLDDRPAVAFNLTTLAMLVGTELAPDLSGHVVMVEEVAEHHYAIDRMFFHVTQHLKGIAGLRLGRVSEVPENDRPFGSDELAITQDWCARSGIRFLGRADIGHDAANTIVPFGLEARRARA
ncbi:MAG: LD-carboxypeptidase [Erythrobacter sp.]